MIQQITAKSVLSQIVRPVLLWVIDRRQVSSSREIEVIERQEEELRMAKRMLHVKQVHLSAKKMQIERGL